jgi:hypothetical protein
MFHRGMYRYKRNTPTEKAERKPRKPRTPIEQKTKAQLERLADSEFSYNVRASAADDHGIVRCVTCGKPGRITDMDCGHYITRARKSVRWDKMNTGPQCPKCNRYLNGLAHEFRRYLVGRYGEEAIRGIEDKSRMESGETRETLLIKIAFYRSANKSLKERFK